MLWFAPWRRSLLRDRAKLGRWGEKRSEKFLRSKGLRKIARNFSCRGGEIDIVMGDGPTVVFVEVKTRRSEDHSPAQDAVTAGKRIRMIRTAKHFLKTYKLNNRAMRFDVVAVVLGEKGPAEVRHYKAAFVP